MRDNRSDPTKYAVYCARCGLQFLREDDYMRQMYRPDFGWMCPSCKGPAEWDDECQETNP